MIYRSDRQDGRRGFIKKLAEIKQEMYVNHDLELSRIYGVLLVRLTTQRLSPLCGFYHCHKRFTASAAFYEVGKNHVRNVIIASNFDYRGCKVIMVMTLLMQIQPPPVLFEVIIALAVKVDDNTTGVTNHGAYVLQAVRQCRPLVKWPMSISTLFFFLLGPRRMLCVVTCCVLFCNDVVHAIL